MKYSDWYGFKRCDFDFMGHEAFIAEPHKPLAEKKWSWCMEWPKAFVERCGALELLERGFYHVHVKIHLFVHFLIQVLIVTIQLTEPLTIVNCLYK